VALPIVGMGGVTSGDDVLDLLAAGASAVALGTILFSDPLAARRIRAELTSARTPAAVVPEHEIDGFGRDSASRRVLSAE
jgi:dihydroorotate dehydrogenase (NAD+) catalytic subunit